jgi:predicted Rossmann fold nucleotide-binding protein DprA/Smf involved in DNA uptake
MDDSLLSLWSFEAVVQGLGNSTLLSQPLTAFFASRQCSGVAIRAAMDWAIEQARAKNPVISGFHSPLEQSVLKILLTASSPCVIVVARKFDPKRLPTDWLNAAQQGTFAIVGIENTNQRLTAELAARRNDWIASHAEKIVVAPSEGGVLQRQALGWGESGLDVKWLA